MPPTPKLENISVVLKGNVYFEGKVVSHTLEGPGASKQTVGFIYPGKYTFNTGVPETMEIIAGSCRVRLAGEQAWQGYAAGGRFEVPGKSSFEIEVENGLTEYLCIYN
jgi:purine/pyrimidine-nucleoside phosphorylase